MLKKSNLASKPSPHSSPKRRGGTPILRWVDVEGKVISCLEKLKILEGNLFELQELCTSQNLSFEELSQAKEFEDALEDAILLGVSKEVFEDNIKTFLNLHIKI